MREPVAYIVGHREFWSLDLDVDRRVLIPRPETETLVDAALGLLRAAQPSNGSANGRAIEPSSGSANERAAEPSDGPAIGRAAEPSNGSAIETGPHVLDLCTGSGAIAIALAVEIAALRVVATDVAAAALEVAPRNAAKHGVAERIEFRQGDLYAALRAGERFDLVVSNPPYCRRSELADLEPEVREWEPAGALVSGADGMDVTRRIVARAAEFLAPEGWLLLEVGTQAAAVRDLLVAGGWRDTRSFDDLAGRVRVIGARGPVQ